MEINFCAREGCYGYLKMKKFNNDILDIIDNAKQKNKLNVKIDDNSVEIDNNIVEIDDKSVEIDDKSGSLGWVAYFVLSSNDEILFQLFSKFNQSPILFNEHLIFLIENEYISFCILKYSPET